MKIILNCGVFRIQEDFSPDTSFWIFKNQIKRLFGSHHLSLDFYDKSLKTLNDDTPISEIFAEDDCITFMIREEYDNKHPLHFAAEIVNTDAALKWITEGTPVDIRDDHGKTPLLYLAKADMNPENKVKMMVALLGVGADITAFDADGKNALHYACEKCDLTMVRALIGLGCDTRKEDSRGRTPLDTTRLKLEKEPPIPTDMFREARLRGMLRTAHDREIIQMMQDQENARIKQQLADLNEIVSCLAASMRPEP